MTADVIVPALFVVGVFVFLGILAWRVTR